MITESGTVVAVEDDSLWVQTLRKSACDTCQSRSGCGQRLLSSGNQQSGSLRVLLNKRPAHAFSIGDEVTIGIPEGVVAHSSLIAYLLPLIFLIAGALVADGIWQREGITVLGAAAGLLSGAYVVRLFGRLKASDRRYQPVIVD